LSIEIKKIRFDKILKVRSSKAFKKGKNERSIFFGIKCPKSCDGLFVFFGALSVDFDTTLPSTFSHIYNTTIYPRSRILLRLVEATLFNISHPVPMDIAPLDT
jgi:hypothetical protein